MPASQAKPSKQHPKGRRIRRHPRGDHRSRTGGKALMEIFANDPLVDIVAVAEIDDRRRASPSPSG